MPLIQLHYRANEYRGFDDFVHARPEYYRVTEYPLAEMMGTDAVGWAQDFVEASTSKYWYKQSRRPLAPGDVLILGSRTFLIMPSDTEPSVSKQILPDWPKLAVKELTPALSAVFQAVVNYNENNVGD